MVIEKGKKKVGIEKELTTKTELEKVDYMVGTFLNEESVKVLATQIDRQKGIRYGDYLLRRTAMHSRKSVYISSKLT